MVWTYQGFTEYYWTDVSQFWHLVKFTVNNTNSMIIISYRVQFTGFSCFKMKAFATHRGKDRELYFICQHFYALNVLLLHPWAALTNKPFGQAVGIGSSVTVHSKFETFHLVPLCSSAIKSLNLAFSPFSPNLICHASIACPASFVGTAWISRATGKLLIFAKWH